MAVLEKIRTKFGLAASIIIALGLLSFIIDPDQVMSAMQIMSSKNDVGKIAGKTISYNDFSEKVQEYTVVNELVTGSSATNSQQQAQIVDAAWQDVLYKQLFVRNANDAGLHVETAEMLDLTSGSGVSPLIAQNAAFMDENGNFSKENLYNFVQAVDSDPSGSLRTYWNFLQNSIMNQRYTEKYASLFTYSSGDNTLSLNRSIAENNTTSSVIFAMIPYGFGMNDSTIVVSDKEVKNYYKKHQRFYEQTASRDIEYVVYEVIPSSEDRTKIGGEIEELKDEFAQSENVKSFLLKNSDLSYNDYWYRSGELRTMSKEVEDFVWEGKSAVSEVIEEDDAFYVVRVLESANVPDSVYVKHILLQGDDETLADSLLTVVKKGGNFANIAAQYSTDKTAADGVMGNLGWLTQTYMIPGFEELITTPARKPFILKTQYGTHIVEVDRTSTPLAKKKVAVLKKDIVAGKETVNSYYSMANQFAVAAAGSYDNYKKAVDTLGVYSHKANKIAENSDKLGAIDGTREVARWAFDNKVGKVSPIITVDNNYFFVAVVMGVHKQGAAEISEVAQAIRQQLYNEKLGEKRTAEVAEKIDGLETLEEIADALGVSLSNQDGVAFSSMSSQGLDPKFIGAVSGAPVGEIQKPLAGSIGTYVFCVTSRDSGAFFTEDDANNRALQLSQYSSQLILPVMMQEAKVLDNRAHFY